MFYPSEGLANYFIGGIIFMPNRQEWVIKNQDGHFINVRRIKKGYYYTRYTGVTTGFASYENEETMRKDLEMLGEGFRAEYIKLNEIPDGIRVCEK